MNPSEYARRRKTLIRMIGHQGIAIIPSANTSIRNRDVEYPFRQDSDFFYLSGFEEPDALIVLVPGRDHGEYVLFLREKDELQEIWHGRRLGIEGALSDLQVDDAFPISDVEDILPGLLEGRDQVYYNIGKNPHYDHLVVEWVNKLKQGQRSGTHAPTEFISLDYYLHDIRLYKSRAEVTQLKKAARVTSAAHVRAMQACKPGMYEYELEAEYLHEFRKNNMRCSYPPIIGSGENACILHYTENSAQMQEGDLVLIDAGSESLGYAADVSRTFPVSGEFNEPQREIYEIVLEAQQAAIDAAVPGNHWNDPHDAALKVITKGLIRVGLLKGTLAANIKSEAYRQFFMHRTGHWLGLDVHDVGDYKIDDEWRLLEKGMAMTVEPGIYIRPKRGVPKRFHNIGVRIEDDVLLTKDGNTVLTNAPKTVEEIETVMASS